ncbi:hypothetical protein PHSC3_001077 [Chlamydiales bacterium STE3]|nr:hypothetical protein PHSC3_001077 [Chlamydiales bacterium STE3]
MVLQPFRLKAKQGLEIMELIKEDILIVRSCNLVYQIESENCAKWVQSKLEMILGIKKVSNLYKIQLLNTEPVGPIFKIFSWIKKLSSSWHVPILAMLHLLSLYLNTPFF